MGKWQKGQSGNTRGRPTNTAIGVHKLREIVTEDGFREIIDVLVAKAKEGDSSAANLLLSRMAPIPKATQEPLNIDLPEGSDADRCQAILHHMTDGIIPVDVGKALLDSILEVAQLRQLEDLSKRLDALEART